MIFNKTTIPSGPNDMNLSTPLISKTHNVKSDIKDPQMWQNVK